MLKYNNIHIFTGYLKQLLSSFNLPSCKIYTNEFAEYLREHGQEDPRVVASFDDLHRDNLAVRINYLKNEEVYYYFAKHIKTINTKDNKNKSVLADTAWQRGKELFLDKDIFIPGFTRQLDSPGIIYDTKTHEYLGDFLRFVRDYYDINLMSLYNCFTDKVCNNIYFNIPLDPAVTPNQLDQTKKTIINTQEPEYQIYAIPVKLFADYTIAIDCSQGIELFCGFYNTKLDTSSKAQILAAKTYQSVHKTLFHQPFLYNKLNVANWQISDDIVDYGSGAETRKVIRSDVFTRFDIINRERDLKLFIKVPISCKSSITVLEGDFRSFNDAVYSPKEGTWVYKNNRSILNFEANKDLNSIKVKPISKLQLLAFNTGESYPFADRLIEYLCGSAITPIDEIPDNIMRVQQVMNKNGYYFHIDGLWENKMQCLIYDYIMNSGPVRVNKDTGKITDHHNGKQSNIRMAKSAIFDILGYVDKDAEKWYASWKKDTAKTGSAVVGTNIQNVDIYNGLYDL